MEETSSFPSMSTPSDEKSLADFAHLFEGSKYQQKTASPPLFSNIVLKTLHNAELDLDVLYNIIPIIHTSPEDIKGSVKISKDIEVLDDDEDAVPEDVDAESFDGETVEEDLNESFISVRKFPKARGYRQPCKIKSFLDLDFYFLNRKFHMKISTNKIAIIGGGSLEKSQYLLETIYHHFISLHKVWSSFDKLTRDQINKVSENFSKQILPEDPEELRFYNALESIIDRNHEDVMERLRDLNPIVGFALYKNPPVFTSLMNCNSVFNYRLPEEICLGEKSILLNDLGYEVMYHNYIIVKCLKATWRDPVKGLNFSFSIQNIGTIKQNSSHNHDENIKMYEKLIKDLGYIPYSEGCEFISKVKAKPTENVVKNEKCIELIGKYLKI